MPQALRVLEKFTDEFGTTPKGREDSGYEYGVAFVQAKIWAQSMVCHQCGVKGQGVNEFPKIINSQSKQFWEDRNKDCHEKANKESKESTDNTSIYEVVAVVSEEDDAAHVNYEHYQRLMSVMEELDIGMVQVGHSDTRVVEDTNTGNKLLSHGTSNTGKQVSWDNITESVSKRFTLDAHKIYLISCAMYYS